MRRLLFAIVATMGIFSTRWIIAAQESQHPMKGMDMKHSENAPVTATLAPAEGANIKIISPKANQVIRGDKMPLQFKLTKGKRGEHVHAYIDGEMVGMFKTEKGTLNGIKPGRHTLELRVVTADHNTELDATDKIAFTVK